MNEGELFKTGSCKLVFSLLRLGMRIHRLFLRLCREEYCPGGSWRHFGWRSCCRHDGLLATGFFLNIFFWWDKGLFSFVMTQDFFGHSKLWCSRWPYVCSIWDLLPCPLVSGNKCRRTFDKKWRGSFCGAASDIHPLFEYPSHQPPHRNDVSSRQMLPRNLFFFRLLFFKKNKKGSLWSVEK